ncbi:hypothetical protein CHR62_09120 [Pusillimonas sp. NJUB218]|nr:hypothetical protein CHR62_09120 [Pusillimonas sp. NJUB218]
MFILGSLAGTWLLIGWLACGLFAGYVASEKNRCGICWFLWGVLFGPVALLASAGLPMRRPSSAEPHENTDFFQSSYQPLPVEILKSKTPPKK